MLGTLLRRGVRARSFAVRRPVRGVPCRAMSGKAPSAVNEDVNAFDNEFLEDVVEAFPKNWREDAMIKDDWMWQTPPPEDWRKKPPKLPIKEKKMPPPPRETYPVAKTLLYEEYSKIVEEAQFLFVFSNYMDVQSFELWRRTVEKDKGAGEPGTPGHTLTVHAYTKNALFRSIVRKDPSLAPMESLFKDQIAFVTGTDPANIIQDINKAMSVKGDLVWIGGMVQKQVVDHVEMDLLKGAESEDAIRSQIIGILMSGPRNIIRALKNPTDNLVKVLQFKAKADNGGEGGGGKED